MKNTEFLQNPPLNKPAPYRIKPLDNLYLSITTLDPEVNQIFNPSMIGDNSSVSTMQTFGAPVGQYINGYRVSNDSIVELPILGKIKLAGLTLEAAENVLRQRAEVYLKEPTVKVKLLNFRVNILGEVNTPGLQYNYEGSLNMYEAIGMAGGITRFADLENVVVNRQMDNRTVSFKIDATHNVMSQSDVFYLQPNDLVYVPPTKLVRRTENTGNYSIFLSTITTVLVIFSFFN
jgi:polysaccharide export outer membrane protein